MRLILVIVALFLLGAGSAAGGAPTAQNRSIAGEVLEVRDVDPYTYLRLRTPQGEIWAAVSKAPVRQGASVTIENASMMSNFESKSLKKTFDRIVFGTLAVKVAGPAPALGEVRGAHPGRPQTAEVADPKVSKAQGPDARTVAEIVGKKAQLKDKPVAVRGRVVKYTANVMGKNWIHLRDGSGSAKDNTNDLLVTTQGEAQIGQIVVARGVVRTDVDLGSGYAYKVLVDGATLQK